MSTKNQRGQEAAPAASSPAKKSEERSTFHVVGPGSAGYRGEVHPPGSTLELTEEEAKSLGNAVAPGPAPKAPEGPPKAGTYKVTAFGSIFKDRRFFHPGEKVELNEQEAAQFADRITPA